MSKPRKKRRRYVLVPYRPVGEFKKGERRMLEMDKYMRLEFVHWLDAIKKKASTRWKPPLVMFAQRKRRSKAANKIVELQVFDENYSSE